MYPTRTPHIPSCPPAFKARTYVVSQLKVFLARQLIVHSFDQLQDLQGEEEAGKEEREERDELLKDVRLLELAQRETTGGAECLVESLKGKGLSELRTKPSIKSSATLQGDRWGGYCDRRGERLGRGSCCVSFPMQGRSGSARRPIKSIDNTTGWLSANNLEFGLSAALLFI